MADKYYRLVCFVVDICADVLRKYFVKLANTDVGNTYTSVDAYISHRNWDVMQLFNNKKLRSDQYYLLYPGNGIADENKWDVSILITLITELFATRLQPLEIFALKTEIRDIRNKLQHHPNTGNISDNDFDNFWERLDFSVRLLAKNVLDPNDEASLLEKINQVKCNHLPNLSDCVRIWHEETSKELLNIMKEMQANAEETTSILRQVTVQKPGPSGEKNKRIKTADVILERLQVEFESTMEELSDDFNPPSEVTDIRNKLRDCHHVVVAGCNNSLYFETALAAIKGMDYNYKRSVKMNTSSDWRHIDPEDVELVLCRDPFGKSSYDESKAKAMDDNFKNMIHSTKRDNGDKALDIVIVTDLKVLEECKIHHDHEILEEVVKVFTDTSSTQPADLTIGCRRQGQYVQSSSLPVTRNNLGAMTKHFLMVNKTSSGQVDNEILKKAKKSFQKYKAIVLTGHEKCGKTSLAVALASAYDVQDCLLLKKPNDVNYIDFPNTCLVIIDEFAGKYRYEENEVYKWYNVFDYLYNAVIAEPMNVIITCEKGKLDKCINEVRRHAILEHVVDVSLQKVVVKSEVPEQYGHVSEQIVTTDHSIGTISISTQTENYTSSLLADPSQEPILLTRQDTIPVSTGNNSILGNINKRLKVADDILVRLQVGFESTMKELSGDFNPPSEVTDIRAKLRDCHHVVVTGCNNSRYFETALAAIKGIDYNYKRSVEMHTSSDWRHIDPDDVDLVLCRDPFGGFSYDESKAKAMDDIFKSMIYSTKRDNGHKALDIVIVTDLNILEECKLNHDHEILKEVVKVFTDTSSTQPADLTRGCTSQGQYKLSSSLPVIRNNLGAFTETFLKVNEIFSVQIDAQILQKAKEIFKANKAIVLTGHAKNGKTSIAVALASAYDVQNCLLLKKPHDIDKIDFPNTCLVIIDEFAGKYRYEENEAYEWYNMFDHLFNFVIVGQMNVVITCERRKLDKCINEIGRHAILDHVVDVSLYGY